MRALRAGILTWLALAAAAWSCRAADDGYNQAADQPRLESLLPPAIAKDLEVNAWGWFSYLYSDQKGHRPYSDVDLALGATQRLGDRLPPRPTCTIGMPTANTVDFSSRVSSRRNWPVTTATPPPC